MSNPVVLLNELLLSLLKWLDCAFQTKCGKVIERILLFIGICAVFVIALVDGFVIFTNLAGVLPGLSLVATTTLWITLDFYETRLTSQKGARSGQFLRALVKMIIVVSGAWIVLGKFAGNNSATVCWHWFILMFFSFGALVLADHIAESKTKKPA